MPVWKVEFKKSFSLFIEAEDQATIERAIHKSAEMLRSDDATAYIDWTYKVCERPVSTRPDHEIIGGRIEAKDLGAEDDKGEDDDDS